MAEIPAYTYEQLQQLNLPGYKKAGTIRDVLEADSDWVPVLSASEFRVDQKTGNKQILAGVRNSNTHNRVASTPTMQTIRAVRTGNIEQDRKWLNALVEYRQQRYLIDQEPCVLSQDAPSKQTFGTLVSYKPNPEPLNDGRILSHYVNRLNTYKLGIPNPDEARIRKLSLGSASLCSVHIGFSYVGDNSYGEQLYEPLVEIATAVHLTPQATLLLPFENERYSHIGWTEDSRTFPEDVKNKDTFRIVPAAGGAAVWFCAYGMCLKATSAVASRDDLDGHLALDDPAMLHRYGWDLAA